ncbi:MAG: tryptophan--tRNA ligase [Candidatus Saganbacteria bacterium]|nr:tryptophan--tRNA ligase [Candidatus Saganbacteria bacterium]
MSRILSGIQPSGKLHLGNLIGALSNWVKLQHEHESFFEIADLHALTTGYLDISELKDNIKELAIDMVSAGLDPNVCSIFIQSEIPEHSELHLLFSMITPISWLERVPTYKSKIEELKGVDLGTYGFLGYPVLQAADILIYKADLVPVGQDQLPHLELTREIARRFNNLYGNVFPEPKEQMTNVPVMPGLDGLKMSKSYGNTIAISDPPETIRRKVSTMITDPARIKKDDPGHPEVCAVFSYHKIYSLPDAASIASSCKKGSIGCVECKKALAEKIISSLSQIHKKRKELESDPKKIDAILEKGRLKASKVAKATLDEAKHAMGLK